MKKMSELARDVDLAEPAHEHAIRQLGQRTFQVRGSRERGMAKSCAVRVVGARCEAPGDAHRPQERRARASCSGMRATGWAIARDAGASGARTLCAVGPPCGLYVFPD